MRVLIYSANFAPDLIGIGKYSGDMAVWLNTHALALASDARVGWTIFPQARPD